MRREIWARIGWNQNSIQLRNNGKNINSQVITINNNDNNNNKQTVICSRRRPDSYKLASFRQLLLFVLVITLNSRNRGATYPHKSSTSFVSGWSSSSSSSSDAAGNLQDFGHSSAGSSLDPNAADSPFASKQPANDNNHQLTPTATITANSEPFNDATPHHKPYFGEAFHAFQALYWPIHGVICLVICTLGIFANVTNIIVLTRPNMINAVNTILSAVAFSDLVVNISNIPYLIHELGDSSNVTSFYSLEWALYILFHAHASVTAHTISIWLTCVLATLRYFVVCRSQTSNQQQNWSVGKTKRTIVCVFLLVPIFCIPNYLSFAITHFELPDTNAILYKVGFSRLANEVRILKTFHFWMFSCLTKVVPCVLLTFFTTVLIKKLLSAREHRLKLATYSHSNNHHQSIVPDSQTNLDTNAIVSTNFISNNGQSLGHKASLPIDSGNGPINYLANNNNNKTDSSDRRMMKLTKDSSEIININKSNNVDCDIGIHSMRLNPNLKMSQTNGTTGLPLTSSNEVLNEIQITKNHDRVTSNSQRDVICGRDYDDDDDDNDSSRVHLGAFNCDNQVINGLPDGARRRDGPCMLSRSEGTTPVPPCCDITSASPTSTAYESRDMLSTNSYRCHSPSRTHRESSSSHDQIPLDDTQKQKQQRKQLVSQIGQDSNQPVSTTRVPHELSMNCSSSNPINKQAKDKDETSMNNNINNGQTSKTSHYNAPAFGPASPRSASTCGDLELYGGNPHFSFPNRQTILNPDFGVQAASSCQETNKMNDPNGAYTIDGQQNRPMGKRLSDNMVSNGSNNNQRIRSMGSSTLVPLQMVKIQATQRQLNQNETTTKLLIAVMIVFLICEFPSGILAALCAICGQDFFENVYEPLGIIMDLLALINSSVNFILYCFMSTQFRVTFYRVVLHCPAPNTIN